MTLIKWNNGKNHSNLNPLFRTSFPSLFGTRSLHDPFVHPYDSMQLLQNLFDDDLGITGSNIGRTLPAINIFETTDEMIIEVAAPGMNKKDFGIEFHEDQLKISYKKESNKDEKSNNKNVWRREYNFEAFERTFSIPETIDGEKFTATYEDGILKITAPKKEEAKKKPAKSIDVK